MLCECEAGRVTVENVGHNKGETTKGLIRSEKTHEVAGKRRVAGIGSGEECEEKKRRIIIYLKVEGWGCCVKKE